MGSRRIHGLFFGLFILGIGAIPARAGTWGDVNDDGAVNLADVGPFIDVLLGDNSDPTAVCAADVNEDGQTDGGDIPDLVDAILNGATDLLVSDNSGPCVGGPFRRVDAGDVFTLCGGFQGFTELFLTLRMAGFDPNATVNISYSLRYANAQSGCPTMSCPPNQPCCGPSDPCDTGVCYIGFGAFTGVPTTDVGCGINQFASGPAPLDILFSSPVTLDGEQAILSVTVTDSSNPLISASTSIEVTLNTYLFCFDETGCPPDHSCTSNYCVPD